MGMLKRLEVDFSYDIVEEFLSHYSLMCDLMEPLIVNLSREDKFKNNIDELFRIFHNIKSAAGYMHIDPVLKLTTLAEDVCEEARSLQGPANDSFIDWLLLVSDQFAKYKNDIEGDAEYFSVLNPNIIDIPSQLD
ncbi:Hpt domain-containing protein [Campylobacter sp. RM9344]|uniref:Hpt domain-containing protein n=1 Tax=Campylobacter californiensis TaxID=1032243 RepID=A0AAW3ZYJ7_9BACT|nr:MULTISPECIES: Hpt domain-containing protein [unclassified Campylobacter]MBE2985261.1 Hpt domain-containing protein [Campylobacter sp. RM6883]MBE2986360.1 Hpt domain-containing protein [Campylobacter sp. RM12919]MBE2988009.1 Hpt domain-containing protein [Campylobacter sp. RM12920]MBE2995928.1 Hpt domain-containing protein [Campylobacter sp. RM6913]MBE3022382.1 Hpt domain-containing protein [Campylobacter sp. 7477a]MBE3030015.1 Hpt domain-containing protein [Campylobacter sp. RM9344]